MIFATVQLTAAHAAEVESLLLLQHTSDLLRGWPLNDRAEDQIDHAGAGLTITLGDREAWEIDITHGIRYLNRGERESSTQVTLRFYPGRLRRD